MDNAAFRQKQITKTSIIGILANVFLSGFKAVVGILAGALSVVLDAVNNLTDAVSSVVTVIGIKLAGRKPDKKHPFGHGRIEYFSAVIIGAIILVAGGTSLIESVKKIISPEVPSYTALTLIVVGVAIIVKIALGIFVKKQGIKYNSEALKASGDDAKFDAIISAATLVSGAIAIIFSFSVEGIVGAIISLFIIKAGIETLLTSANSLIGNRVDGEFSKSIRHTIEEIDGVYGAYDLILHNYGPQSEIGSVHVEISSELTAEQIHKLTRKIQYEIYDKYKVFMTVGIYAVEEKYRAERIKLDEIAKSFDGVIATHGLYVDEEEKTFSLDVVTDFTVKDRDALGNGLKSAFAEVFPSFNCIINFDTDYSD